MKSQKVLKNIVLFSVFFFMATSAFAEIMEPINTKWRWRTGDVSTWATENISSSSLWLDADIPGYVEDSGKFWVRGTVTIPSSLQKENVYFETGALIGAAEIYANGVLIGRHGSIEPKLSFSHVANTVCLIPSSVIKNNQVEIAIKCSSGSNKVKFSQFFLVDAARFQKTKYLQSFLNTTVYFMMSAICLFLGLYFLMQFFADKSDKSNLSLALTLIFITIYFLDIASEILLFPYLVQISISRCCLVFSIGFIDLFILQNFKKKYRIPQIIIFVVFAICAICYAITSKDDAAHELMFSISLLPIFAGIIFLFFTVIKAVRNKERNARKILMGISIGMIFGLNDIIYEILGQTPFAWLQGFSFFFVDITMFLVVSIESIQNKKRVNEYIQTTSEQKNKLNNVIKNAAKLSSETSKIANTLNESIVQFSSTAAQSAKEAGEIGSYIEKQNKSIQNTAKALDNLLNSVQTVKSEIATETQVVFSTVNETSMMIDGVKSVTVVVNKASDIAKTLGKLAVKSSDDVSELVHIMEIIKDSSTEILGVVQVVTDFANRTNMLAMNASIEAAHSGIQGKGFSVIAHEIKKLASASTSQAEKIRDIVTSINDNIMQSFDLTLSVRRTLGEVSKDAEKTSKKVDDSAVQIEKQYEASQKISEATDLMSKSAKNVQNEANQQYLFSKEVSENMEKLSNAAAEAESAVEEIIAKNKELSEQTSSLQNLARRAKDATEGLNALMNENE